MKRRNFLKGLFGVAGAVAIPAAGKAIAETVERNGNSVGKTEIYKFGEQSVETSGNAFITPEQATREALNILNDNLSLSSIKIREPADIEAGDIITIGNSSQKYQVT